MSGVVQFALRALGGAFSRRGDRLLILAYHRVLDAPDPLLDGSVDREMFDWHLRVLKQNFNVLPLGEAVSALDAGTLPPRVACITFDDGYADNYLAALPLLQAHSLAATFFVATAYLDGGCMFNDLVFHALRVAPEGELKLDALALPAQRLDTVESRRKAAELVIASLKYRTVDERHAKAEQLLRQVGGEPPTGLMMTRTQLRALADAGMEIGAHTNWHPILARLAPEAARAEIETGRDRLQEILERPVDLFAYPNGGPLRDYRRADVEAVRELGFRAAVSTAWGAATIDCDRLQLPRVAPWDRTAARFLARLVRAYTQTQAEIAA